MDRAFLSIPCLCTINDVDCSDTVLRLLEEHAAVGFIDDVGAATFTIEGHDISQPLVGLAVESESEMNDWEALIDAVPSNVIVYHSGRNWLGVGYAVRLLDAMPLWIDQAKRECPDMDEDESLGSESIVSEDEEEEEDDDVDDEDTDMDEY